MVRTGPGAESLQTYFEISFKTLGNKHFNYSIETLNRIFGTSVPWWGAMNAPITKNTIYPLPQSRNLQLP